MPLSRKTEQYYPQVVGLVSTGALYSLAHPLEQPILNALGLWSFGILGFLFSFAFTGFFWASDKIGTAIRQKPEVLAKLKEAGVLSEIELYYEIMALWFLSNICSTVTLFVLFLLREPTTTDTHFVLFGCYTWFFVYISALLSYIRVYWIARALQK